MKDKSKLFDEIPEDVYIKLFSHLQKMREKYPPYRDDQLLMFMLCEAEIYVTNTFNSEGFTHF